jgi:DNA invertase Pin-like site-specific DNA recombinase
LNETRRQLEKQAAKDSVQIVKIYEDFGVSGISPLDEHPGMSMLLEDATKGVFEILYIAGIDRLSRRTEHAFDIIGQLKAAGVRTIIDRNGEGVYLELEEILARVLTAT